MSDSEKDDDWERLWNERIKALELVLGPAHDRVFHALIPFDLDGYADVQPFLKHLDGVVYVTAELTGRADSGNYELMICHRTADDWGPNILSKLAKCTLDTTLNSGDSMDIGPAVPDGSEICAFLFDTYGTFQLLNETNELRLCLGITQSELDFKLNHGAEALIAKLKSAGVYPFTDLRRHSTPL